MITERGEILTRSKEYDLQEAIDYFRRRAEDYRRRRALLRLSVSVVGATCLAVVH